MALLAPDPGPRADHLEPPSDPWPGDALRRAVLRGARKERRGRGAPPRGRNGSEGGRPRLFPPIKGSGPSLPR